MPLLDLYNAARDHTRNQRNSLRANNEKLGLRLMDVFARTWDLGFTAFGGPPVHFQILHRRFVDGVGGKTKWIDEQTYQELFAICQALPGPGSTKMTFCIALIHAGFIPALFAFMLWSLPGAIGMYALALGIQNVPARLPAIVYALLSGLNASTVGIIALAAVQELIPRLAQLAEKAIKDKLTRILVLAGACAGLCYNALWYFPVLMLLGGLTTILWDIWLQRKIGKMVAKWRRRRNGADGERDAEANEMHESIPMENAEERNKSVSETVQRRTQNMASSSTQSNSVDRERTSQGPSTTTNPNSRGNGSAQEQRTPSSTVATDTVTHGIPIKTGILIIVTFFISFTAVMVLRGTLPTRPLPFDLFANMYLAGTVIFGGGPVVIPLLRSYVVEPGWVSPRDFLIGLAIIQAFPGPNFNFSVYLGALTLTSSSTHTIVGAILGFLGIFVPGITLAVGVQSLWRVLRTKPAVISVLRGINATAVGLVFTAVYRLWGIGYLTPESSRGRSLADEPWWVVVAAVTYAESAWFGVPPAMAIVIGAILGLGWYGAVGR